ncbi:MAG: Rieske 2Fe-2S domain-containing protein [Rhodospirillales bacterium]
MGRVADIQDGGKIVVETEGEQIGVFRIGNEFFAWKNKCPHQGGPVCQGRIYNRVLEVLDADLKSRGRDFDDSKTHIVCPWHGLEFDIRTGEFAGASAVKILHQEGYPNDFHFGHVYVVV